MPLFLQDQFDLSPVISSPENNFTMLNSKANLYPEMDQLTSLSAIIFRHPARLQIIRKLTTDGRMSVEKLAMEHPISLQAFSQHIGILREKQIIQHHTNHPYIFYDLDVEIFQMACNALITYLLDIRNGWTLPQPLILKI